MNFKLEAHIRISIHLLYIEEREDFYLFGRKSTEEKMVSISIAQPSNEEEIKLSERELFQYISMPLRFATNLKNKWKNQVSYANGCDIDIYI